MVVLDTVRESEILLKRLLAAAVDIIIQAPAFPVPVLLFLIFIVPCLHEAIPYVELHILLLVAGFLSQFIVRR